MYNTKEVRGDVAEGVSKLAHANMNYMYLVIGALSGVILTLILAIASYFSVKRCKNPTQSQVIKYFWTALTKLIFFSIQDTDIPYRSAASKKSGTI